MAGRPEVSEADGGMPLVEHRVAGGILRVSEATSYALGDARHAGPEAATMVLDHGLVWANITGPSELQIRHGPTVVRTRGAQMLMDAGPGGEALLVVITGAVDVATGTTANRRLVAGMAGQFSPTGTITEVAGITEPELAGDPWARANRRLDAERAAPDVVGEKAPVAVGAPVDDIDPEDLVTDRPADAPTLRRELEITGLLALALLLIVGAVAFVVSGNHSQGSTAKPTSGRGSATRATTSYRPTGPTRSTEPKPSPTSARPTSTGHPTSAPTRRPPTTRPPTSRPVKGQLASCRQPRAGQVLIGGRVADPLRRARSYRIQVRLVGPTGATLAGGQTVVAALPRGATTPWTVSVTPPPNLFGVQASCRLVAIAATP